MPHPLSARAIALAAVLLAPMAACGQNVDQAPAVQVFEALPNGGIIELQRASNDSVGMREIRTHLRAIAQAFISADVAAPPHLRLASAPGARVMLDRRNNIRFDYRDLPRGGALRISTADRIAQKAIWEFIAYQRNEHLAGEQP
jgi:hypothetical protein